jgi:hypothetical protein
VLTPKFYALPLTHLSQIVQAQWFQCCFASLQ